MFLLLNFTLWLKGENFPFYSLGSWSKLISEKIFSSLFLFIFSFLFLLWYITYHKSPSLFSSIYSRGYFDLLISFAIVDMFWGLALKTWPWQPAWASYLDTAPATKLVGGAVPTPVSHSLVLLAIEQDWGMEDGEEVSAGLHACLPDILRRGGWEHATTISDPTGLDTGWKADLIEGGHWFSLFHYSVSSACWVKSPFQVWGKTASFSEAIGATVENIYSYIQKSYCLVLLLPPQSFLLQNLKLRQTPS